MRRNARNRARVAMITALCAVIMPAGAWAVSSTPNQKVLPKSARHAGALMNIAASNAVPLGGIGFSQGSGLLWESDDLLMQDLDGMIAAGATWVGVDVDWPSIQAGGPNSWNWTPTDRLIFLARAKGLQVLATADYTPAWARPANTSDKYAPQNESDFAIFAAAAAARYAPLGVHAWQIWNEPNTSDFWQPAPDAAAYARLLIAGADAIHGSDPNSVVMNGGLAPAPNVAGRSIAPNDFIVQMYLAGIAGHIDAISMHPYTFPYSPTTPQTWNLFYMLSYTHLIMSAFGDGARRIWATESGYGTGRDSQSVSQAMQATRLRELVAAWRAIPFAGNLFVYGYRDLTTGSSSVWNNMGIVRHDFSPKLGAAAFRLAVVGPPPKQVVPKSCIRSSGLGGPDRRRGC